MNEQNEVVAEVITDNKTIQISKKRILVGVSVVAGLAVVTYLLKRKPEQVGDVVINLPDSHTEIFDSNKQ